MKNYQQTTEILESFYFECLSFWQREKAPNPKELALKDLKSITTDPYSPNGEKLDMKAKEDFINKQ